MLFNSFIFLIFLPLVCMIYYLLPHRFRWIWLLGTSCCFYMAFVPVYILILAFTIVVDYFAGIFIENAEGSRRKTFLVCSLIANIGVLAVFKYYNFINENLTTLLHAAGVSNTIPYLSILLPIGLSFHTFQAMSYTIEVYRGNQKAERHFGIYSLYVLFFPQLVAGPIERPQNMLHQFYEKHSLKYSNLTEGCRYILWGMFMKLVVADRLSLYVTAAFDNPGSHTGSTLILAAVFFSIQIYCDFGGYSNIAIGSARLLGFNLMKNFDRPYLATSLSMFWRKWHISLSSWFSDYVYKPLGGSRVNLARNCLNLLIVFSISGLWHGANWTYVVWGASMGTILALERILLPWRKKLSAYAGNSAIYKGLCVLITFILITLGFIIFRSNSIGDTAIIMKKVFTDHGKIFVPSPSQMILSAIGIVMLFSHDIMEECTKIRFPAFNSRHFMVRNFSYIAVVILILLIGVFDGGQFIYFQF